ncbi:transmembrane protein 177-like [Ptychodera flava]|uniref:transmembrane protein 177-like n=1 Tax=Ptychodera flava TaxID=63121 RepID=UPI00396A5D01
MASRLFKPKNVRIIVGLTAGGVFCFNAVPLLFPGNTVGRIYHSYKDGTRSPISEQCREEFDEVCRDLGIKNARSYRLFPSFGTQIHTAGLPWLPGGVPFGVPDSFVMQTTGDVKRNMKLALHKIDWESDDGNALAESLLLSRNARKFYIARELMEVKTSSALMPTVVAPAFIIATFTGNQVLQVLFRQTPPGFITLCAACMGVLAYLGMAGLVYNAVETGADKTVARVSGDYAKGGVEFYGKLLRKNQNLRKLLGKKGERMYSYYGNENMSALNFRPAITERRKAVGEVYTQMRKTESETP